MQAVAEASSGIDKDEKTIMKNFVNTLSQQFKNDIENYSKLNACFNVPFKK